MKAPYGGKDATETRHLSRRFVYSNRLTNQFIPMGIFRAIGSGMFLAIIALMMPTVFSELTKTLIVFLRSSQEALTAAGILASYAGQIAPVH
ncbi:MAG: hypothetical protein WAN50_00640 [Minisyncoccia bacterium]